MTRLDWHLPGSKRYGAGLDRGVLYPEGSDGVPWNGLVAVTEKVAGGETQSYYYDGEKINHTTAGEDFEATIEAFSSPAAFDACDGSLEVAPGMYAGKQYRKQFGMSYRTKVGNDLLGIKAGVEIHIIYNALAGPSEKVRQTIGERVELGNLSWDISTVPVTVPGFRPTAHYVIKTSEMLPDLLEGLEEILYGSDSTEPRLPTITELRQYLADDAPVTHITAIPPTFNDLDFVEDDTYTLPDQVGVIWRVGLYNYAPGTYTAGWEWHYPTINIMAVAADGYALDGTTHWSYTFETEATPEYNPIWFDSYLSGPNPATFPRAPDVGAYNTDLAGVDGSHFGRLNTDVGGWGQLRGYATISRGPISIGTEKHAVEMDYDFTFSGGDTPATITAQVNCSWGNHNVRLTFDPDNDCTILDGTATASPALVFTPIAGADLTYLPREGTFRVETDTITISVYIDGVLKATCPTSADANPGWADPTDKCGFTASANGDNSNVDSAYLAIRNVTLYNYA